MENSRSVFQLLGKEDIPPVGYKEITFHIIFGVKMAFTGKASYVAGRYLTEPPSSMTYSSVVIQYRVYIAFLVYAINNLDILDGGIKNAHLNAPIKGTLYLYSVR